MKTLHQIQNNESSETNVSYDSTNQFDELSDLFASVNFHQLEKEGNSYITTHKLSYEKVRELKSETIDRVFDFAYTMAFDEKHRKNRSGGKIQRRNGEIFANTFQGKLAECAAVNLFYKYDKNIEIDFDTYDLGTWDKVDITVCKKEIAIKSTKHFGQLLLLETKDWNKEGEYIPNIGTSNSSYAFIVLVRIKPSCEDIMKKKEWLYEDNIEKPTLKNLIKQQKWSYDCVGYITNHDLRQIIKDRHIIPQGALLNGKTPMDAENYYVQAGDMRKLSDFDQIFTRL